MEHIIRAATIAEITPILRIDKGDYYVINKALETGAGGILVPDISSREEGEELIIEISNDVGVLRSVWKALSSTMKGI